MAQPPFDPYKPPRSLAENEALLKGAEDWEATKAGWRGMLNEFYLLLLIVGGVGGVVLALWLGSVTIGVGATFFIMALIILSKIDP